MSSNFDKPIKNIPQITSVYEGRKPVRRALTLSSSANESGVNSAKKNKFAAQ